MPEDQPPPPFAPQNWFRWSSALFDEMTRLPETMREVRELVTEQARVMRRMTETVERLTASFERFESTNSRLMERWQEANAELLARMEGMMDGVSGALSQWGEPMKASIQQFARLQQTLEEMRDGFLRLMPGFPAPPPSLRAPRAGGTRGDKDTSEKDS